MRWEEFHNNQCCSNTNLLWLYAMMSITSSNSSSGIGSDSGSDAIIALFIVHTTSRNKMKKMIIVVALIEG